MKKGYKFFNETVFEFAGELEDNFTTVHNEVLLDERLSNNAVAVYIKIQMLKSLKQPITIKSLVNKSNGESKVRSALKELKEHKFIKEVK